MVKNLLQIAGHCSFLAELQLYAEFICYHCTWGIIFTDSERFGPFLFACIRLRSGGRIKLRVTTCSSRVILKTAFPMELHVVLLHGGYSPSEVQCLEL